MRLLTFLALLPLPAMAEAPRVVTDIPPVHGLVSRVMQGVDEPLLILDQKGSAHHMAMRPSQARVIAAAQVVFRIGDALTPTLERSISSLAPKAQHIELLDVPGTETLPYRAPEFFTFQIGDAHEGHHEHDDKHVHNDDHKHDDKHEGEDPDMHGDEDPHAWLSPSNAVIWLGAIAETLATRDPVNANRYRENARQGRAEIFAASKEALARLTEARTSQFVVAHDAYHYMENAFGLSVIGAMSDSHAREFGPAQLAALRDALQESPPDCILAEAGTQLNRLAAISDTPLPPVAEIDPLGFDVPFGPGHYVGLLEKLSSTIAGCIE